MVICFWMEEENLNAHNCLPPSTKDVLGGHLHQKVREILSENCIDGKVDVYNQCSLADKITGILLERSLKDIYALLQDEKLLLDKLRLILDILHKECPHLPGSLPTDKFTNRQELSHEDIGEMVFERVFSIEESMAPQITGMLLELDDQVLLELINSDGSLLETAVRKAKEVLASPTVKSSLADASRHDKSDVKQEQLQEADRESIEQELYAKIHQVHPECAGNLTGMMLELDLSALKVLLNDKQQLQVAIARAYTEWTRLS